MSETPLPQS
jgi:WD40 repeat protein